MVNTEIPPFQRAKPAFAALGENGKRRAASAQSLQVEPKRAGKESSIHFSLTYTNSLWSFVCAWYSCMLLCSLLVLILQVTFASVYACYCIIDAFILDTIDAMLCTCKNILILSTMYVYTHHIQQIKCTQRKYMSNISISPRILFMSLLVYG